jgi:20S proteasome subunit beta 2
MMEGKGMGIPKATKTGTTIVGLIYKDGLVLGADTRATAGPIVADKNCEKIHYLAPNMYCCGAGTAADTEMTTALISSQLELHRLSTGRQARVVTAMTMLKQMLFKYDYFPNCLLRNFSHIYENFGLNTYYLITRPLTGIRAILELH